jgi:hypothetical protein
MSSGPHHVEEAEDLDQLYETPERRANPYAALAVILVLAALSWLPFLGGCW